MNLARTMKTPGESGCHNFSLGLESTLNSGVLVETKSFQIFIGVINSKTVLTAHNEPDGVHMWRSRLILLCGVSHPFPRSSHPGSVSGCPIQLCLPEHVSLLVFSLAS